VNKNDAENELKSDIVGKNITESIAIFEWREEFINAIPEVIDHRF